jgi:hypothetical protein
VFNYRPNIWFGTAAEEPQALWNSQNIDKNASNIRDALHGLKYIVRVEWRKIYYNTVDDLTRNAPWSPVPEFEELYMYPYKKLGEHAVIVEMRGIDDETGIFMHNEFGMDAVFVGTNIKEDATMIALKYK